MIKIKSYAMIKKTKFSFQKVVNFNLSGFQNTGGMY